jgi:hypothetical protein
VRSFSSAMAFKVGILVSGNQHMARQDGAAKAT